MNSGVIRNIGQLVTARSGGNRPVRGAAQGDLECIANAAVFFADGKIVAYGVEPDVLSGVKAKFEVEFDAQGGLVTPGLVDPHTHPIFAATREDEFYLRNAGKSYMEIAAAGGGIRNSARKLRAAESAHLVANAKRYLQRMLRSGTTTIEAKSGYGLSLESELKSLEVIARLNREQPIELVPTFLGAHEFPDEYRENRPGYVDLLVNEMIPEVARRKLAEYCDIFTEAGVFDIEQSRRIMQAAKDHGLKLKFHAEELKPIGGAELAAELGAVSADHLVYITDSGIAKMAAAGTIAVLLPATTFFLGHKEYAPARKMIGAGVPVALATDFNPGSSCTTSLGAAMTVAAIQLKMTPEEILNAVTVNSAAALDRLDRIGSVENGKQADLVVWECENYRQLPYLFAQNPVKAVFKRGERVV